MATGVFARADGSYAVELDDGERALLRRLAVELDELVAADDETVGRLFPAAHRDDPAAEREYRKLAGESLVSGRLDALREFVVTVGERVLDQGQAEVWCGVLNDLRLVLGERLGVTEELYEQPLDLDDPRVVELSLYGWLTWIQSELVDALASRF